MLTFEEQVRKTRASRNGDGHAWKPLAEDPEFVDRILEAELIDRLNGVTFREPVSRPTGADWLIGSPMDPAAETPEPMPTLPGFPFLHRGAGAVIVGPTGGGRSSLVQACLYDAARAGLRCAYLGHEVTQDEFDARAAHLARVRGDEVDDALREQLARVRYFDLTSVIGRAWGEPEGWVTGVVAAYDLVVIDPLSAVESATGLNFEQRNTEFIRCYDRLVQPLTARGVAVILVDNVGHAIEAKTRAKGASAKSDRADLTFSCALVPGGLSIRVTKVRSIRAGFRRGDEWLFRRASQTIERTGTTASEQTETIPFRPTHLMKKASRAIEDEPGATMNAIRKAVGGKAQWVTEAVRCLIEEGFVETRQVGQATRHYGSRPYREDNETESRDSGLGSQARTRFGHVDRPSTESQPIPSNYGLPDRVPTESRPSPDRVPDPVQADRVRESRDRHIPDRDSGTRSASLVPDLGADAELERIRAKFGSIGVNDDGEAMPF